MRRRACGDPRGEVIILEEGRRELCAHCFVDLVPCNTRWTTCRATWATRDGILAARTQLSRNARCATPGGMLTESEAWQSSIGATGAASGPAAELAWRGLKCRVPSARHSKDRQTLELTEAKLPWVGSSHTGGARARVSVNGWRVELRRTFSSSFPYALFSVCCRTSITNKAASGRRSLELRCGAVPCKRPRAIRRQVGPSIVGLPAVQR